MKLTKDEQAVLDRGFCDSECEGRCRVCPEEVVRKVRDELVAVEATNADLRLQVVRLTDINRDHYEKWRAAEAKAKTLTQENAELRADADPVRTLIRQTRKFTAALATEEPPR